MNKLSVEKQATVISGLVEGVSIRSMERMTGVHRDTIMRLGVRVGQACGKLLEEAMHDLPCQRIEADEIWCYVGKKERQVKEQDDASQVGDFYTFVALDPDTKLVPVHRVGKRDLPTAQAFMDDLGYRLKNRIQLSTDGLSAYAGAVERVFGSAVNYAQVVKAYEAEPFSSGRYSPPKVVSQEKTVIVGHPDLDLASTSLIERQNLTMRMQMRRFTRLTNAFSKKLENLEAAVALHFAHYNFVRRHGSIRMTPAMAAGVTEDFWKVEDLVALSN